mgnify:CR=1 FL=1
MNEIDIKRHSFDVAKNRLKEFSEKTEAELEIDKVRTYYDRKVFTLLNEDTDEIELYDVFETMWDVCGFFLKMEQTMKL